ncbi:MAG: polysaccharide biosynthesis tyrosine autokinase [Paludibacteraceae bacterium]|nr:polysaccharide biosynthesis tyrosine autokinase [Paludibacteraceae bacterium]MBN2787009.1 polysaccharide biosynthesis tyrosine autokinase [Paludibacteraceae bacterium]
MTTETNQEDVLNIKELLFQYLSYWKWMLASVVLCILLAGFYLLKTNKEYEIKTSILIKEEDSGMSELAILDELGLASGKNNIDNEIEILKSADLIRNTIYATNYHIVYSQKVGLRKLKLYSDSPLLITIQHCNLDTLQDMISMYITKSGANYSIETSYKGQFWEYTTNTLPTTIGLPLGRIKIEPNPSIPFTNEELFVSVVNPEKVAVSISKNIKITPTSKKSSVISLSIQNENTERGKAFLQKLIELYNLQAVEDKNQIAYNTGIFIDERLKSLSIELSNVEQNVENFKTSNKITDISSEAKLFLEQTGTNEQKLKEVETQLNIVGYVSDFVNEEKNKNKLIPNLGITDVGLSVLINKYNELTLEKERIESASTSANPILTNIVSQLNNMRSGIKNSVSNVKKTLLIAKKDLNKEGNLTSDKIQQIPRIEREFIEIKRQQQIKETLYLFLLQKREETNLTLAATAPKAKIVSQPRADSTPVSPKKSIIILIALILGIVIPVIIIYIKNLFELKITNREELEKLCKVPLLGEIPKNTEDKNIVVGINDTSSMTELFRSLRNDLTFIVSEPTKKIIAVTSTVSGEGKTFIATNLACTFAMIDKKVLLVGLDIRNPSLANYIGLEKKQGITSYLATGGDFENLIEKSTLNANLDIIQAGIIPPNPNELLNKDALDNLFNELRKRYDYILLDTAPVGIISDTFLVNRISDMTLYVTRENITEKASILYLNELYKNNRLTNLYVVYNDSDIEKKRYGYSSKHYYGYSYGYKKNLPKKQKYSFSSVKNFVTNKK